VSERWDTNNLNIRYNINMNIYNREVWSLPTSKGKENSSSNQVKEEKGDRGSYLLRFMLLPLPINIHVMVPDFYGGIALRER